MFEPKYFDLTEEHVKLVRAFNIRWDDDSYEGAPAVDTKRPFGNSDAHYDMAEILGVEPIEHDDMEDTVVYPKGTSERLTTLYHELDEALQVILAAGSFAPGKYTADDYSDNWKLVDEEV